MNSIYILVAVALCHTVTAVEDDNEVVELKGKRGYVQIAIADTINIGKDCSGEKPKNNKIPAGYNYTENIGAYKYYPLQRSWNEARKICVRDGAHLAIPNSQAEVDHLRKIDRNQTVWLGIHDLFHEGEFVTVLDQPIESLDYNIWRNTKPDRKKNEDCVTMSTVNFNNINCKSSRTFICEVQI